MKRMRAQDSPQTSTLDSSAYYLATRMTRRGVLGRIGALAAGAVTASVLDLAWSEPAASHTANCNYICGPSDLCASGDCSSDSSYGYCNPYLPRRGPYGVNFDACTLSTNNSWNVCFCGVCGSGDGKYKCSDCCSINSYASGRCTGSVSGYNCGSFYRCICKRKLQGCPASCPECTPNHKGGFC